MTTHVATEAAKTCCNIAAESWMLIHSSSYSRHLIQCKNHESLWVNKSTCQIDRTALMRIHAAAKATNTYHNVAAKVLATQSWWFMSPTPDSLQKSWVSMSDQFYERAKSTALLLRLPAQRQKQLISAMKSLPKSWMPIRNGSYSRNLFQAKQRQKKTKVRKLSFLEGICRNFGCRHEI